ALAALTLYPNEAVLKYMQGGVAESDNRIRRRRMVDALCATFAASRASLVEDTVTPLLAAEDPHLRVSAAKCLGRVGGPKAKAALQNYRANVAAPWEVREAGISQTGAP
ncbi:MAG TPA: HEAT repeat domain-containing protein, partial [Pseudomonadales bacterium]|nr:HEAT repeat domain-containing protein [Pseudomonadales bacterium]